jgi:rubrerythrin
MPAFADPFYGNLPPKKLNLGELVRAIRLNVAAEEEAAAIYQAHADATDNPIARKVLIDVANEERVHAGEFLELLRIITEDEEGWLNNGAAEVQEMADEVARGNLEPPTPEEKVAKEGGGNGNKSSRRDTLTIGSLKE